MVLKARPNDRNMLTEHVTTLLAATCCMPLATLLACEVFGVVGSNVTIFKVEPTTLNLLQHGGQTRNMFCPTMLRYLMLACCDHLARA